LTLARSQHTTLRATQVLIQSNATSSARHIPRVLSAFVASRGASGLYAGLAANLAASAPISAIYTASYEAAKQLLLPYLSTDHAWVAHCAAGGLASVCPLPRATVQSATVL
jgi:hypothetical protein